MWAELKGIILDIFLSRFYSTQSGRKPINSNDKQLVICFCDTNIDVVWREIVKYLTFWSVPPIYIQRIAKDSRFYRRVAKAMSSCVLRWTLNGSWTRRIAGSLAHCEDSEQQAFGPFGFPVGNFLIFCETWSDQCGLINLQGFEFSIHAHTRRFAFLNDFQWVLLCPKTH